MRDQEGIDRRWLQSAVGEPTLQASDPETGIDEQTRASTRQIGTIASAPAPKNCDFHRALECISSV